MTKIILASSSPHRKKLLHKLGLEFTTQSPAINEAPEPQETAAELVSRLAQQKAKAIAQHHPDAWIIGSDQVADLQGQILGKPGNFAKAKQQLQQLSGQQVCFYTGLCLHHSANGFSRVCIEPFNVHFRKLSDTTIERYLERDQPFDCAGSFKSEGLGIALFERLEGDDPNSLIGLPLIRLIDLFTSAGIDILSS